MLNRDAPFQPLQSISSLENHPMNLCNKAIWSLAAAVCVLLLGGTPASAQTVTTGSLTGVVEDAQGGVLPGATVTAVHTPTGTSYDAVTDAEGRFDILNVRVGPLRHHRRR